MRKSKEAIGLSTSSKSTGLNVFSEESEVELLKKVCLAVNETIRASMENRTVIEADGIYSIDSSGQKRLLKAGNFIPLKVSRRHYVLD